MEAEKARHGGGGSLHEPDAFAEDLAANAILVVSVIVEQTKALHLFHQSKVSLAHCESRSKS